MNRLTQTDPLGQVTQYRYDNDGNITRIQAPSGATTIYGNYTTFGQPRTVRNANNAFTVYHYDAQGRPTDEMLLADGVDPGSDPQNFVPASAAQVLGWTKYTFDAYGNVRTATRIRDFATLTGPVFTYDYDASGLNLIKISRQGDRTGDGVADAVQAVSLGYDSLGRVTSGIDGAWHRVYYGYDKLDRVTSQSDPGTGASRLVSYNRNSAPTVSYVQTTEADGVTRRQWATQSTLYDAADRPVTRLAPGGHATRLRYDAAGNLTQSTDPDGYTLTFEYDAGNRLVRAVDGSGASVRYALDALGRARSITDPNGLVRTYTYYGPEHNGRLQSVTEPGNRTTRYEYDVLGRLTRSVNPLGQDQYTYYDAAHRPVREVGPVVIDPSYGNVRPVTLRRYDLLGALVEVRYGRTDAANPANAGADVTTVQASYTIDDFGRLLRETDASGGLGWRYSYDLYGNRTQVTSPRGQAIQYTYTYDPLGALTRVASLDAAGNPELAYDYAYDEAQRLVRVSDSRANQWLGWQWSPGGQLNRLTDSDGRSTAYQYAARAACSPASGPRTASN